MLTWFLVALGGAIGSGVGLVVLRKPSPTRLLGATASICGLAGAFGAQLHSAALTSLVGVGVLGSAASMVAIGMAPPVWLRSDAIMRSMLVVVTRLAWYCAVGVTFALVGYLAVRGGTTLYVKLT